MPARRPSPEPRAFVSLRAFGPRAQYDRRRSEGDRHSSALRNTFNRMLGCLYHCLQEGKVYDELAAFPASSSKSATPDTADVT
ncbi:hypothetical protein GCM10012289_73080 [Nonomuraea cavernae]|uniref:IS110 family transposase n=1 Tax=Nonomuraea cavernae TaxID=2045107 RepID=A0A918DT26_9ACTN|nr:hypothetical protein GCM10012289_73080 [Nonomuraea cavernae]